MARERRGFVLLVSAMVVLALAGIAGLAIDIGHMYAVRAEAQSYADSLALTAARELDGTGQGLQRARQRMSAIPRTGFLRIAPQTSVRSDFSADGKNWETAPSPAADLRSVRVRVALDAVDLFFLPAVIPRKTASVQAVSVAEQQALAGSAPNDMLPFAIYARTDAKPDFGYREGDPVTLRWSPAGSGCGNAPPAAAEPLDGYIQGISRRQVREAVEDGLVRTPVVAGQEVRMTQGDSYQLITSLAKRAGQDTNKTARTWFDYQRSPGNSRRLGMVAVVSADRVVLDFVRVFLPLEQPAADQAPLCAEYAGAGFAAVERYARLVR